MKKSDLHHDHEQVLCTRAHRRSHRMGPMRLVPSVIIIIIIIDILKWPKQLKLLQGPLFWGGRYND